VSDRTPTLTPDWLSGHIDELLDRGPGFVGMAGVTYLELDSSDEPMSLIAADVAGLVLAEWDSSDDVDVRFVPWREVRGVGVHGADLDIYLSGEQQTVSFEMNFPDDDEMTEEQETAAEEEREKQARDLARKITAMMRRAGR
jgi:hypothetical protein